MRLMLLGLLFAASAASADVTPPPGRPSAPSLPLSVWRVDQAGAIEHLQSGLICPAAIGDYRRDKATMFDRFGLDVGCDYIARPVVVTVYLTRRSGGDVAAAMAEAKSELLTVGAARHPRLLSETRSGEAGLDWTVTLYAEDGGLHSGIWMADLDGWTLEYRVTYPADADARVLADLKPITAVIRQSAGARLALCAKSLPPPRGAAMISNGRDLEKWAIQTSLLNGAALAAAQAGKIESGAPSTWCVEAPLTRADLHLVYWRGVDAKGADAGTDRITPSSTGLPPSLVVAPDALAGLIEDTAKGKKTSPHWVATLAADDKTLILAYFDGRPAPDAVADLFQRILTGQAKPIGSYGAEGKSIVIGMPH